MDSIGQKILRPLLNFGITERLMSENYNEKVMRITLIKIFIYLPTIACSLVWRKSWKRFKTPLTQIKMLLHKKLCESNVFQQLVRMLTKKKRKQPVSLKDLKDEMILQRRIESDS